MRFLSRGLASSYTMHCIGLSMVALLAVGCGTVVTDATGDTIDLDSIDLNDINLDGVDIDQDTLSKLDIKSDTISVDAQDAQGTDATGTDATSPDTDTAQGTDAVDTASGCTSTADCDDKNPCTEDTCGSGGVCGHSNNTASCNDGNACTVEDICASGACTGGAKNCADENPCTDDSCDTATGCVHLANAATCNDGIACTLSDTCTATACVGIPNAATCADGNVCTDNACDPAKGCVTTNNTAECSDDNPCTTGDTCVEGGCSATPTDCNDNNTCTSDSCNMDTGECTHTPTDAICDDGNVCTTGDYCDGEGTCVGDGELNCNDDNACTADSCNSGITEKVVKTGCVHTPLTDTSCSDGNACTFGDWCMEGACLAGDPTNCNDDNKCTNDTCNPDTGACVNLANAVTCDDGDPCTLADTCTQTACEGTPNACDQGPYNNNGCNTMICDYTDGLCKQNKSLLWAGTFKTAAGWKLQGEWQIGLAAASTDETFGAPDPGSDSNGDGYLSGTVIGGNISNTPHDWYYLTSPVIDLSAQATSTYLYSDPAATGWQKYDQSLILSFEWFAGLSAAAGQYVSLECSGDGQTWIVLGNPLNEFAAPYWLSSYNLIAGNNDPILPKEMLTKHFQFRIGYKVTAVEAIVPLVSGLTVDNPQIAIGSCWD